MGIISIENADHLYWLGRYTERVYTTLRVFFHIYDQIIEQPEGIYGEYCERLNIPNIYQSNRQFVQSYLFEEENPDSVFSNMKRAYDNAIVLRYLGIPARYVNGLMIGEGYTHAWVEAYLEDGWYGFDPTNNLHIDDYYIKLAHGRDYRDCTVDKGCFLGSAAQKQKIYVNVEEISNDGDSGINRTSGGGAS